MFFSIRIACLLLLATQIVRCQQQVVYQRLTMPSENAMLKIVPHMEVPMTMAPSVQSGMNFKMPITLRFPTMADIMRPTRTTVVGANVADQPGSAESKPRFDEELQLELIKHNNASRANSRALFYRSVERSHPALGKTCLLRAICEVAEVPSINTGSGIIGELIDLLLT